MRPVSTLNDIALNLAAHDRPQQFASKRDGRWEWIAGVEALRRIRHIAMGLAAAGILPGDRVAILAENRPEWALADLGILCAGAVSVPFYPTLLPGQIATLVRHSGARAAFAGSAAAVAALAQAGGSDSELSTLVAFDAGVAAAASVGVLSLDELERRGAAHDAAHPARFLALAESRRPDDLATLIYTSGTTGEPKGVMLSHANLVSNILAATGLIEFTASDRILSFLPLSHVLERMVDYSCMHAGAGIAYAESLEAVPENLRETRPTCFAAVPRLYEKVRERVRNAAAAAPPGKRRLLDWAMRTGTEALAVQQRGGRAPFGLAARRALADALVFRKIRGAVGGRIRFALSGGAPLPADVNAFFWSIGLPVFEGYGLTETSPVLTLNTRSHWRIGSVGRPIPGVEVAIAADGEIMGRGPNVMMGYWHDEAATCAVLSADGWFATGDVGHLDEQGFLFITDRKKEILVNSYGKNIAPAPIEAALKSSQLIAQPVLLGDRRPHLAALLVPNFEWLQTWSATHGFGALPVAELVRRTEVRELFQREIDTVNAALPPHERIVRFALLDRELTLAAGELTPTLKLRRKEIARVHAETIAGLYVQ